MGKMFLVLVENDGNTSCWCELTEEAAQVEECPECWTDWSESRPLEELFAEIQAEVLTWREGSSE